MLVKIASLLATIRPLQHFPSLPLTVPGRQDSEKNPRAYHRNHVKKNGKITETKLKKKPESITKISQSAPYNKKK